MYTQITERRKPGDLRMFMKESVFHIYVFLPGSYHQNYDAPRITPPTPKGNSVSLFDYRPDFPWLIFSCSVMGATGVGKTSVSQMPSSQDCTRSIMPYISSFHKQLEASWILVTILCPAHKSSNLRVSDFVIMLSILWILQDSTTLTSGKTIQCLHNLTD